MDCIFHWIDFCISVESLFNQFLSNDDNILSSDDLLTSLYICSLVSFHLQISQVLSVHFATCSQVTSFCKSSNCLLVSVLIDVLAHVYS